MKTRPGCSAPQTLFSKEEAFVIQSATRTNSVGLARAPVAAPIEELGGGGTSLHAAEGKEFLR